MSDAQQPAQVIPDTAGPALASVRALLSQVIDYAGLFPPATLDMATTVANYARFRSGDESWILSRLIVPVARLDEFEQHAGSLLSRDEEHGDPWFISALTAPADSSDLEEHLARIAQFNEKHADPDHGLAVIDAIEVKATKSAHIDAALDVLGDDLFPFFELPVEADPRGLIASLAGADAGAKIRTGSVEASMHPSPADTARFIAACADADVPFKATAGLHEPLRHFSDAVQAEQFGFLNVFIAAALAGEFEVEPQRIEQVLVETDASAFTFDRDKITWRDFVLDCGALEDARLTLAISFGSCSVDEPIEGLQRLGLG